jgi:hypothetical protein
MTASEKRQIEVIKQNWKQFEAFINGTHEVLVSSPSSLEDSTLRNYSWKKVNSINDFNHFDTKFVINDDEELVEMRKELAIGKELLFFELGEWKSIEETLTYDNQLINENFKFDKLYQFIGLYKTGEKKI